LGKASSYCRTKYDFPKPLKNHKKTAIWYYEILGLNNSIYMLKIFCKTQKYVKLDAKKPKNQEYRNCDMLVVGSMATHALILVDTSE